uniref:Uncharacterized protein n=1 Tax=Micrurus carvalhoi TaxID=3147026 RepID=A0A2H6NCP1_9SAUR
MIWMSPELRTDILEVEIEPSVWAVHNPIKLIWRGVKNNLRWTLNQAILRDKEFTQPAAIEIGFFFRENTREDISLQNLWDTAKAYFRGLAITHVAKKTKRKRDGL